MTDNTKMREAFERDSAEAWSKATDSLHSADEVKQLRDGDGYMSGATYLNGRWDGWRAAWQAAQSEQATELEQLRKKLASAERERDQSNSRLHEVAVACATAERELETERMRLAACGVIAMANTQETAAKAREMRPEYWSASAQDCANAVDREMALRERIRQLETQRVPDVRCKCCGYLVTESEHRGCLRS